MEKFSNSVISAWRPPGGRVMHGLVHSGHARNILTSHNDSPTIFTCCYMLVGLVDLQGAASCLPLCNKSNRFTSQVRSPSATIAA